MLGPVVVPRSAIEGMLDRLAREIDADMVSKSPVFIGVLKGCVFFFTDLVMRLNRSVEMDFIQVSSYGASTTSSGSVVLVKDITVDVRDRDIYLVEDIVDTGRTFSKVIRMMQNRNPRSLKVCTFLNKQEARLVDVVIDFCGVDIPNEFAVGYGLDFAQEYRNLPYIGVLDPD